MKLETVLIPRKDSDPLTYLETKRYVFTKEELIELLADSFSAGCKRALGDTDYKITTYINNLFKD